MKRIYNNIAKLVAIIIATSTFYGCSLVGLDVQKDYDRVTHTLDPNLNINVWDYLKQRSQGTLAEDQIFTNMMDAIAYAEIDSNEYKKPGRTFILIHNIAATDFFKNVKVNNVVGTSFRSYPKEFVKNYLSYLILDDGVYDHYTLPPYTTIHATTLAPAGYFNALPTGVTMLNFVANTNPQSLMYIKVLDASAGNTSDFPIQLNDALNARTSSLLATNGSIHVIGARLIPSLPL
ncbi:hypothetical protein ADIARSV_3246 [Arcticibacter svalbardensis MN12-7]|uniref:FAS1 domain-containing protein n=1 Tax=Arcticibacter svalbardensis MN12-7 TaxID=1150600 RepID=R9GP84_9SPHI|nr:hypothetical protein [Arcticibacter svalbardensis]EOR93533.1 hypothetical protein ADIARSV_3246 [Arcticibacter svalbardensis MN12-7]